MSSSEKNGISADPLGPTFFVFDCRVAWLGHGYLVILSRFNQGDVPGSLKVGKISSARAFSVIARSSIASYDSQQCPTIPKPRLILLLRPPRQKLPSMF